MRRQTSIRPDHSSLRKQQLQNLRRADAAFVVLADMFEDSAAAADGERNGIFFENAAGKIQVQDVCVRIHVNCASGCHPIDRVMEWSRETLL